MCRLSPVAGVLLLGTVCATAAAPLPGQVTVMPDYPQALARYPDGPFFLCGPGDPEDFLYRGERRADGTRDGDQQAIIEKLAGTGANCLYLIAVRSHGGDGDATHNPFRDSDPAKGLDPALLDQWEQWFTAMDRAGLVIYLFIYDDSTRLWNTGDVVGGDERAFLEGLVGRFGHHQNLIWCIAEEYQEALTPERVRRIAEVIRAADEYAHPIAVHKLTGTSFAEFADDPNLDQFAMQLPEGEADELHRAVVAAWREGGGRYSLNMSEAPGFGTGASARRKVWACAMGGAYVMVYGMDVAQTPRSDLEDCGRLVRFFEATDFYRMAPHDELALGATRYVLARPEHSYIAYRAVGREPMGLAGMAGGEYDFRWFDCADGREVWQKRAAVKAGRGLWPVPAPLGEEVALYLRRSE